MNDPRPSPEENIICRCFVVTEYVIRECIRNRKLTTVDAVTAATNAGGGCTSCHPEIEEFLKETRHRKGPLAQPAGAAGEDSRRRALIRALLEREGAELLRPNDLQAELLGLQGNRVLIRFRGRNVGTFQPSYLALKRHLVRVISQECSQPMVLVEVNVLEQRTQPALPSSSLPSRTP